jgi:hypothetical protein
VTELAYVAALESEVTGLRLAPDTWALICRMTDAAAALVDATGRPPRQGDGDGGVALRVDGGDRADAMWSHLLALGETVFGAPCWWPRTEPNVFSTLLGSLARTQRDVGGRPVQRPDHFADAGITLLRTRTSGPEIWCRCDGGPHGFRETRAHAHADALSIELRHGGVDILADPGTYCYHTEPTWRSYFRSTRAHNTIEIAARDQSRSGGPFLWLHAAKTRLVALEYAPCGTAVGWCAEHDGYRTLSPGASHRRTVRLDAKRRALTIVDRIDTAGSHPFTLHFHLGPTVGVVLRDNVAALQWCTGRATMQLPRELSWCVHRGEHDPVRGWYSPSFGTKTPSATLIGTGTSGPHDTEVHTTLEFHDERC